MRCRGLPFEAGEDDLKQFFASVAIVTP